MRSDIWFAKVKRFVLINFFFLFRALLSFYLFFIFKLNAHFPKLMRKFEIIISLFIKNVLTHWPDLRILLWLKLWKKKKINNFRVRISSVPLSDVQLPPSRRKLKVLIHSISFYVIIDGFMIESFLLFFFRMQWNVKRKESQDFVVMSVSFGFIFSFLSHEIESKASVFFLSHDFSWDNFFLRRLDNNGFAEVRNWSQVEIYKFARSFTLNIMEFHYVFFASLLSCHRARRRAKKKKYCQTCLNLLCLWQSYIHAWVENGSRECNANFSALKHTGVQNGIRSKNDHAFNRSLECAIES